ncbi:hypothetical protein [Qipengyuania sphaerica]|uniref:hypothetical protein n=1 Tax=Qipengyuania sphaerica TaxID=2867243 RepID=UPI001C885BB5|nr:hypothetical protein [Qipengyuania sphaerica]MBX7539956.1 hypothetical protein [Qipengyuania sphaerica]
MMTTKIRVLGTVMAAAILPLAAPALGQEEEEKGREIVVEGEGKGDTISDEPDPVICKTIRLTGSRLGEKRVCRRESQVKRDRAEIARDINQKTQSKPHSGN